METALGGEEDAHLGVFDDMAHVYFHHHGKSSSASLTSTGSFYEYADWDGPEKDGMDTASASSPWDSPIAQLAAPLFDDDGGDTRYEFPTLDAILMPPPPPPSSYSRRPIRTQKTPRRLLDEPVQSSPPRRPRKAIVVRVVDELNPSELMVHFEPKGSRVSRADLSLHRRRRPMYSATIKSLPQVAAAVWRLVNTRAVGGELPPARLVSNNDVLVVIRVQRPADFLARLDVELYGPAEYRRVDLARTYALFRRGIHKWFTADYPGHIQPTTAPFQMLLVSNKNRRDRWLFAEALGARRVPW